jgi:ficolin
MKYVMDRLSGLEMKLETEIKRRRLETETFEAENKQRRSETEELFRIISELTKDKMLNKNEHMSRDEIITPAQQSTSLSPLTDNLKTTELALELKNLKSYFNKGAAIEKEENVKLRLELKNISKQMEIGTIMSESRIDEKIRNFTNYVSDKHSSLVTVERFNNLSAFVTKIATTTLPELKNETRQTLSSLKSDIETSMSELRRETRHSLSSLKSDIETSMSELRRETRHSLSSTKFDIEASILELSTSLRTMNKTFQDGVKCFNNFSNSLPSTVTIVPNTMKSNPTEAPISLKPLRPSSCKSASDRNGVLFIYPKTLQNPIKVYCDQSTDGGGWLVIQRRKDGSVDFYRTWADYKIGFGDIENEFWIGNDNIHALTSAGLNELRIDMEDFEGNKRFAKYSYFKVKSENEQYSLEVYGGDAKDSLTWLNGIAFSTKDRDNDKHTGRSCSVYRKGAWWYYDCATSSLNGFYNHGSLAPGRKGIIWQDWNGSQYSLKTVEMKIR